MTKCGICHKEFNLESKRPDVILTHQCWYCGSGLTKEEENKK